MARMVHDVFLASPFEEFQQLRQLLNIEISKMASRFPISLVDLNHGAVTHSPPIKECIKKAKQSDFMILLMGDTYGSYAPNENKSYTHLEYESVVYENSPTVVLVFCIGNSYENNNIKYSDDDNFKQFQQLVESQHTIGYFPKDKSIGDIGQKIIQELLIAVSTRMMNGHMMQMPTSSSSENNLSNCKEKNEKKKNIDIDKEMDNLKNDSTQEKTNTLLKEEVQINSKDFSNKIVKKNTSINITEYVHLYFVVLASGLSAYVTYLGFSSDLPLFASGVIAAIIGFGLFKISMRIKKYRKDGRSLTRPLLAFSIFLIYSFISNTSAFYQYFLTKGSIVQTQITAEKNFNKGTTMLLSALHSFNDDGNKLTTKAALVKIELDETMRNLYDQIINPLNPGLGKKAKEHLSEIERILGSGIIKLKSPGTGLSMQQYKIFADDVVQLIDKQFIARYIVSTPEKLEVFKKDILQRQAIYKRSIIKEEFNRNIIDSMARDLESLQVKAEHLIYFNKQLPRATPVASFKYTYTNIFDGVNKSAIVLSVLLSLMLDTLAPILTILLFRRREV